MFDRVTMHGVRSELLKKQAASIGLPLDIIEIPYPCNNDEYVAIMKGYIVTAKEKGIECFAFGDLFLENVRVYRELFFRRLELLPYFLSGVFQLKCYQSKW